MRNDTQKTGSQSGVGGGAGLMARGNKKVEVEISRLPFKT
jgi:hypothetical protein